MKRVVKPKGYIFVTFPYLSPFRKIKANFHLFENYYTKKYENIKSENNFYSKSCTSLERWCNSESIKQVDSYSCYPSA